MTDEKFERFVADAARRLYNPPPEPPRDEMWKEIRAARERRARRPEPRRRRSSIPWWVGIAAALAIGIGIGRLSLQRASVDQRAGNAVALGGAAGEEKAAPSGAPAADGARPAPAGEAPAGEIARPRQTAPGDSGRPGGAEPGAPAAAPGRGPRLAEAPGREAAPDARGEDAAAPATSTEAGDGGLAGDSGESVRPGTAPPLAYRVATARLLGRSEAFLATFRAESRTERLDPGVSRWARELLSSTRLLLDSPAAEDAAVRRLLADLELILAQIVQLGADGRGGEVEYIDRGLENSRLIPRIQATAATAVPPAGI